MGDAGKTFRLEVEARDRKGRGGALSTRIGFVVHVLDSEYRMTLVLSSPSASVERDMSNITQMLSDVSGFTVREHMGRKSRIDITSDKTIEYNQIFGEYSC